MILVAGGTGRLGGELISLLRARGEAVRVLSRRHDAAVASGCELSVGDVRDRRSVDAAMTGVDTVVSAMHGFTGGFRAGPRHVDHRGNVNLIDAAAAAGVRRFVLISAYDARADNPMDLHRAKHAAESYLRRSSLDWTIVRPTAFLETWLTVIGNKPGVGLVFGSARNRINLVSVTDVASVVDGALQEPATVGRTIDVAGPANLTMLEIAEALQVQRVQRIPRTGLRAMGQFARPISPAFARQARTALAMDTIDMTADIAQSPYVPARRSLRHVLDERPPRGERDWEGS